MTKSKEVTKKVTKKVTKRAPLSAAAKKAAAAKRKATIAAKKAAAPKYTTSAALLEKYGVTAAKYYSVIEGAKFADKIRSNRRPSYRYGRILAAIEGGAISDVALAEYFDSKGVAPLSSAGKNKEIDGGAAARLNYLKGYLADLVNPSFSIGGGKKENRRVLAVVDDKGATIG